MTSSRSSRSRAASSSFGYSTWSVRSVDFSAGVACLRGLDDVGVAVVDVGDVFRDVMREVMKARD